MHDVMCRKRYMIMCGSRMWSHVANHMCFATHDHMWQITCGQITCEILSNHMWSNHVWTTTCDHHAHAHYKMTTQLHSNHAWETCVVSCVSIMHDTQMWSHVVKSCVFKSCVDIFQITCDQITCEQSCMIVTYLHMLVHYKMTTQLPYRYIQITHGNHVWSTCMYTIKWISITFKSHVEITHGATCVNHIINNIICIVCIM